MQFTREQLVCAYRKAKKEAFADTNCAHGLKFLEYERNLTANLARLRSRLNRRDPTWCNEPEFLGACTYLPKSLKPPEAATLETSVHYHTSDPLAQWSRNCNPQNRAIADFRPVIDATVDFMVVSALWVLEVGHLFDARLDDRYAVGNRLRRWRPPEEAPPGQPGELNRLSSDLFQPYFLAYKLWRELGLQAMRRELEAGHRILAVTMDLQRFYHQIDPRFLLNAGYLTEVGLVLSQPQSSFTGQLQQAMRTWSTVAFPGQQESWIGLPVGLTASSLIANVLLAQFDRHLVSRFAPVYYARYVDDVFLVLRHEGEHQDGTTFIRWMAERLRPLAEATSMSPAAPASEDFGLRLNLPYAENSVLFFAGQKQKIFDLEAAHGLDLIGPIEEQIRKQSSEFRDFPEVPSTEREMAHRALLVTPDANLDVDALRKADAVALRRSGFALLLGDVEAYARDLQADSWVRQRREFYGLALRRLLTPLAFFELSRYYPRIVGVMASCGDWDDARRFVRQLARLLRILRETCALKGRSDESALESRRAFSELLSRSCANLKERIVEAVLQTRSSQHRRVSDFLAIVREALAPNASRVSPEVELEQIAEGLLRIDWSRHPYWTYWISDAIAVTNARLPSFSTAPATLLLRAIRIFRRAARLRSPDWRSVIFSTRPIPFREITTRVPSLLEDWSSFRAVVMGLRGTWVPPTATITSEPPPPGFPRTIRIPGELGSTPKVAITSLEVHDNEWAAAADGVPILSHDRYVRLNRLLDTVADASPRPDYVVLPELSIPRAWAFSMLDRLLRRGISVIAGLEYHHDPAQPRVVHNQALVALRTNFPGYNTSLWLLQAKTRPAWTEQQSLEADFGRRFPPPNPIPDWPIYRHQSFHFGVLICSELTDISSRHHFQGKVDALFVPEWNRDLESFSALVESAALDVHAYIVQANNRRYGDSRMRAPMKDPFRRDVVRVKGGLNDYFVIAEIDFMALRRFQSHALPPTDDDERFKPFPIGFPERLSPARRTTPD